MRNLWLSVILSVAALPCVAQATLPVTGWYDGKPVNDGVTHGNGFTADGPLNTYWNPVTTWQNDLKEGPNALCTTYSGNVATYPSSIVPLSGNSYVFYGDGTGCCGDNEPPNHNDAGPIQDPLSIIVRYSNGHYDQQSYALWLPNTGITDPGGTQANYDMGMGAFCAAVHGPEVLDVNGNPYDVATLFFGADEYGQD